MLATAYPHPFSAEDWWFDLKWDGFRCLAYIVGDRVQLRSRNGNDLAPRFPELRSIRASEPVVLDGEIVAFGEDGKPSFFLLGYQPPQLVVFDVLQRERPLVELPLEERWENLQAVDLAGPVTRSQPTKGEGEALYDAVKASGLEGIVAKRSGSRYFPGRRSPDWRKIVARSQLNAVVGGYLRGTRGSFGSLLLGLYDGERLLVAGSAGSGLDNRSIDELWPVLKSLERSTSPFSERAEFMGEPVWVEPRLVARIEYREWTPDRRLRAPVFKGIARDHEPSEVTWENEAPGVLHP
jgi:bifunctional non-homologous end joining protein LigD